MNIETNARRYEKRFRAASYALVFLMMTCIILTLSVLISNLLPHWHPGIISGILFFIVIDRLYTYRQLKSLPSWTSEWAVTFGAQWLVIVVFSRFVLSYANGSQAFLSDLRSMARGDMSTILTPEFIITLFLSITLWILTAQFLELLDEIGLDMKWALSERPPITQADAVPAHQRMVSLIFTTGVILVILTAMTRLNLRNIVASSNGLPSVEWSRFSGAESGALLYFVFGLALLSLSRLMSLQTHWNRLRIPVSSVNLPRQWAIYSLLFLLMLAMVVSLLPAGDSLGFFSVLGTLFGFLISVLVFLGQLIMGLFLLLLSLPFFLFGQPPPFLGNAAPPPLPALPTQPTSPATNSAIWELIRSILLWGALVAILVYAFIRFVTQHEQILAALRKSRITNWLVLAWQWLYKSADQARSGLVSAIAEGWQRIVARLEGSRVLPRPGWLSLRSLDPRRRVYFFYLAMIRRGGEQGLGRDVSQTPAEYAARLERSLPESREDIDSITDAFVKARYSRHEVNASEANLVKSVWERIRRALQDKLKKSKASNR